MFGLDGELDAPVGVGDELQEALQRQYGGEGSVLPVGALLAVHVLHPRAEVEGGQIGELQGGDGAASVGGAVHAAVVYAHEVPVGGQPYIAFQCVGAVLDGLLVCGQSVFRGVLGGSSVGDDLDAVLPCLSHPAMVSPRRGKRGAVPLLGRPEDAPRLSRNKGWRGDTQVLLTVA